MTTIELLEHDNGGHNNNTSDWNHVPEGWAVFPDGDGAENFPFFHVDATEEIDGVLTVTRWHPLPVPEPEPEPEPEPTQLDRVEAQATYTAMVTDTLLEV